MTDTSTRCDSSSRRAVNEEGVSNSRDTLHNPFDPLRVETEALKYQSDEVPFEPIVGFAHVGFNRHRYSLLSLGRLEIVKDFMSDEDIIRYCPARDKGGLVL